MDAVQEQLVSRLRAVLNREQVRFQEDQGSTGAEPYATFQIGARSDTPLEVELTALGDQFNVAVNEAFFFVPLDGYTDGQDWIDACGTVTQTLISADLRIRFRRTPFGDKVGAVWVGGATTSQGAWSGHAWACRGGKEITFPYPWFTKRDGG